MAASMDVMARVHKALAKQLLDMLETGIFVRLAAEGEMITNEDGDRVQAEGGEAIYRTPSAAEMGVAVAFLKANNITASVDDNDELKALVDKMRKGSKERKIVPLTEFPDADGATWQ